MHKCAFVNNDDGALPLTTVGRAIEAKHERIAWYTRVEFSPYFSSQARIQERLSGQVVLPPRRREMIERGGATRDLFITNHELIKVTSINLDAPLAKTETEA